jgi:hypothetical protein
VSAPLQADWLKWLPQPSTGEAPAAVPQCPAFADGIQAAIAAMMRENKHIT